MNLSYAFRNGTVPSAGAIMADHASNLGAKAKKPFTMKDYLAQRNAKQATSDILDSFKEKAIKHENELHPQQNPNARVTRANKVSKGIFRLSGIGHIEAANLKEAGKIAKELGYTAMRSGIRLIDLAAA